MTKLYEDRPRPVLQALRCNRCGAEYDARSPQGQDFLSYYDTGGYGSCHGDGTIWSIDLCGRCTVEVLGSYILREES